MAEMRERMRIAHRAGRQQAKKHQMLRCEALTVVNAHLTNQDTRGIPIETGGGTDSPPLKMKGMSINSKKDGDVGWEKVNIPNLVESKLKRLVDYWFVLATCECWEDDGLQVTEQCRDDESAYIHRDDETLYTYRDDDDDTTAFTFLPFDDLTYNSRDDKSIDSRYTYQSAIEDETVATRYDEKDDEEIMGALRKLATSQGISETELLRRLEAQQSSGSSEDEGIKIRKDEAMDEDSYQEVQLDVAAPKKTLFRTRSLAVARRKRTFAKMMFGKVGQA